MISDPITSAAASQPHPDPRSGLLSRTFIGLMGAQFLGAANDNIFRWLVVQIGKNIVEPQHAESIVAAGVVMLVLPFILLGGVAGWLADRFSKRTVIVVCKGAELAVIVLGVFAILQSNIYALFLVLFLMGSHSALFAPAKLGAIPEIVRPNLISAANAVLGLVTVVAIVLGTKVAYALFEFSRPLGLTPWWPSAMVLIGVASCGWLSSMLIRRLPAAAPDRHFEWNLIAQLFGELRALFSIRPLTRVALGSAFFWAIASLAQVTTDVFGSKVLGLSINDIGSLMGTLALGTAIGNVLAGIWSRGRIELGLVPLAALGMVLSATLLSVAHDYYFAAFCMVLLGVSGGLFVVPLDSYLQRYSPEHSRGSILAASNVLTFTGMLLSAGLFALLQMPLGADRSPLLGPRGIFLFAAALTVPVMMYALLALPVATIRFVAWLLSSTIYRVKLIGHENIPSTGGVVLAPNHVSLADGVLLGVATERPIRMMIYADYYEWWPVKRLFSLVGAIPIMPGGKRSVIEAIKTAREALRNGEVVCIFPEGGLSRTGQVMGFQPGLLSILKGSDAKVVPVYLGGLWGSIFSLKGGRYFGNLPQHLPYRVQFVFGQPLENVTDIELVRRRVIELETLAMDDAKPRHMILPRQFIRACRRNLHREKVVDTTGQRLTGGTVLLRTLIVRRLLLRHVLGADEKCVGVLLPPSAMAVLANAALPLCGRVAVNLNYTVSSAVMNHCIRDAGIRHVLTSRLVMKKLDLKIDAELVYVEDLRNLVTKTDKAIAALQAFATPAVVLDRILGLHRVKPDDLLTIIFTSGSTGEPKGVMLTYYNVGTNVEAINELIRLSRRDTLLGVVPFFHSLGFTVTCWTILTLDLKGAYHVSPLEAQKIGELCRQEKATLLLCTPTFMRSYLKRVPAEDFKSLDVVVGGAEKLPGELCDAFEQKFGVRPVEGYGTTECSPLVSVNIPHSRQVQTADFPVVLAKQGTVGRPIPGMAAKIVDPDSGAELGVDEPGMLLVKGPNVMPGYLNKPEKTAEVLRDGWYTTGDIALIDRDGFIKITGRLNRFSKIGGEMVPHLKLEEALQKVIGAGEDELKVAVTAVPDPRKGERLVVVHTPLAIGPAEICKRLSGEGLPNLFIPSQDSFVEVETIPHLGTGKLDLKGLKELALARLASEK